MIWYEETLHDGYTQRIRIDRTLYQGRTAFQDVLIFENSALGRVLVLDGIVQTTEGDEFIYHEMTTHLPILAHGAAKSVLIIGGGDGGALEEALKHDVANVTMVDIDGEVIDLCREYLPSIAGRAFDDPRTNLIVGDGNAFVAETDQRFDVIVVDSPDPIGPAEILFEESFYARCRDCLTQDGIIVTQNGVPFLQGEEVTSTNRHFAKLFAHSGFYAAPVPTYSGGFMAFGWGSNARDISKQPHTEIADRFAAAKIDSRYYNPAIHTAAFALPGYIETLKV